MSTGLSALTLGVIALVAVAVLGVLLILSRYKIAGPNQAFILTGRKGRTVTAADGTSTTDMSGQKVVIAAGVFVIPFIHQLAKMDLSSRRITVTVPGAVTQKGVKAHLEGVAVVKVGGTVGAVRAAAQRFLTQQDEIDAFTQEVLAGALRSIAGTLTVEELIRDRAAFASKVAEEAENSLSNQGLVLDTFQIQDVKAEGSYLEDLGRPEAARAKQEAAIAEARARQAAERERLLAEEAIAEAQRNLALKQATIQAETDAARARADASGQLAKAERDQAILAEQQKVAERNAELKQRQLDTEVRKPADAQRYRVEQEAEAARNAAVLAADAQRQATIAAAQAVSEQARLTGEGEKQRRAALAEATRLEGEAEAAAVRARGEAEAAAMQRKAEAYAAYGDAALIDRVLEVLPAVVRNAAEPMGAIDTLTVISPDGAAALPKTVATNMHQGMQMLKDLTGVDVPALVAGMAGSTAQQAVPASGNGAKSS